MKTHKIDYRHFLSLALILGSVAMIFVYRWPLLRAGEACRDFGRAFVYSFASLLGFELPFEQTVNTFSAVDLWQYLGIDLAALIAKWANVWQQIFVWENFLQYLLFLLFGTFNGLYGLCWALIGCILFAFPIVLKWNDVNNRYGEKTKPLKAWERLISTPYRAAKRWGVSFVRFFAEHGYWRVFVAVWLFILGVFTVILEFLAYYMWLIIAFDFSTIGKQIVKLMEDVLLAFSALPWPCWALLTVWIWSCWRRNIAENVVRHNEAKNKGLLAEMPMCLFCVAPPRTGKTTSITDFALSYAAFFRYKALELMQNNFLKFPDFPWILFEKELQCTIVYGNVWNLATVRAWVRLKYGRWQKAPAASGQLYGYKGALTYNDHLVERSVWEVLENYAQEYFIYWHQTSFILSNYPIRDDFRFKDAGNFPLVDTDFFSRDAREVRSDPQFSHVLDYDMLRLGMRMEADNPHVGALEFGVILISEIDKERKNDLRLREMKLDPELCNPKNDMMNEKFKMMGQDATVENFCFLRFMSDAQRPSSWGADARELTVVLHIEKHTETLNAIPFFWVEDWLIGKYLGWYRGVWQNARYKWGNDRLITYLLNVLAAKLYGYRLRHINDYGYYRQPLLCESGTLEKENVEEKTYFVAFKKIYAERFATDYFKFFSETQALRCQTGLNDVAVYNGIYPTMDHLAAQNSFFASELLKFYNIEEVQHDMQDHA